MGGRDSRTCRSAKVVPIPRARTTMAAMMEPFLTAVILLLIKDTKKVYGEII